MAKTAMGRPDAEGWDAAWSSSQIGDYVRLAGRSYRILGFDPIGADRPHVHLEDVITRQRTVLSMTESGRGEGGKGVEGPLPTGPSTRPR